MTSRSRLGRDPLAWIRPTHEEGIGEKASAPDPVSAEVQSKPPETVDPEPPTVPDDSPVAPDEPPVAHDDRPPIGESEWTRAEIRVRTRQIEEIRKLLGGADVPLEEVVAEALARWLEPHGAPGSPETERKGAIAESAGPDPCRSRPESSDRAGEWVDASRWGRTAGFAVPVFLSRPLGDRIADSVPAGDIGAVGMRFGELLSLIRERARANRSSSLFLDWKPAGGRVTATFGPDESGRPVIRIDLGR